MGLLQDLADHPLTHQYQEYGLPAQIGLALGAFIALSVVYHVASQFFFQNPNEPPLVFSWFPIIGSTITYGMDPPKFFKQNRAKVGNPSPPLLPQSETRNAWLTGRPFLQFGDVFTFILLGKKTTVAVGQAGNDFILNGKLKDVNAEEIYTPLTTPVFGRDVVYDCPNAKLMEQKKVSQRPLVNF